MKYHALFVIFEKAAKFEIVFCKFKVALYGLLLFTSVYAADFACFFLSLADFF